MNASCAAEWASTAHLFGDFEFAPRANLAHWVLGALVFAQVGVWALFAFEALRPARALRLGGALQALMGLYLLLWLFVFVAPRHAFSRALWRFTVGDVTQLQHLAMALLLLAAGGLDALHSTGRAHGAAVHVLWALNSLLIGALFLLHPQRSPGNAVRHQLLGLALASSALLFLASRLGGLSPAPGAAVDWGLVTAGFCYSAAGVVLLSFREAPERQHLSLTTHCQPAVVATLLALGFALLSLLAAAVAACARPCRSSRERRATSLAPARSPAHPLAPQCPPTRSSRTRTATWRSTWAATASYRKAEATSARGRRGRGVLCGRAPTGQGALQGAAARGWGRAALTPELAAAARARARARPRRRRRRARAPA